MRPIMVEFTGTPEAGKTTVIKELKKELEIRGFNVIVIQESAELVPTEFPKGSWNANLWMRYITCSKILHSLYMPCDIILIDRGIIDQQFFGLKFFVDGNCSINDFSTYMNSFPASLNPDYVIAMVSTPETSLLRRGGPGRVVNLDFLNKYNSLLYSFYETITIPKALIETSNMCISDVTNQSLTKILPLLENFA